MKVRASSNMKRLRKGDEFQVKERGEWVTLRVEGWAEKLPDGTSVRIPVRRSDGRNITRRVFNAADRVKLI